AEISGEFVFNLATWELRGEMNITGSDHPEDVSEAELANLKMVPSRVGKPPRVERSPIALECIHSKTVRRVQANGKKSINSLVIGEVVNVHIDDAVIIDGNIDMARIRPIARLGYMDYTSVDNIFTMHRVPVREVLSRTRHGSRAIPPRCRRRHRHGHLRSSARERPEPAHARGIDHHFRR